MIIKDLWNLFVEGGQVRIGSDLTVRFVRSWIQHQRNHVGLDSEETERNQQKDWHSPGCQVNNAYVTCQDMSVTQNRWLFRSRKAAKDKLTSAMTSLEHGNYSDAYEDFKKAADKASEGFHTVQVNNPDFEKDQLLS